LITADKLVANCAEAANSGDDLLDLRTGSAAPQAGPLRLSCGGEHARDVSIHVSAAKTVAIIGKYDHGSGVAAGAADSLAVRRS
jgi:hypothetical protein